MRYSSSLPRRAGVLIGASVAAIVLGLQVQPASAQTTATARAGAAEQWTVNTSIGKRHPGRFYFIEFRARSAASYGHMYVLYGRVNGRDEIVASRIAGLHPAGDANDCFNCSLFNWTIGHLVPVPSETGASDGDLEEKYVTARYRVWLTAAEFKKVDAYIRKLQADSPVWNALVASCVSFGRDIAVHMGLKVPIFPWIEPKPFVDEMRELNGLHREQLPLKDAVGGSVHAASHVPPLPPYKPAVVPASTTEPKPAAVKKKAVASVPPKDAKQKQIAGAQPKEEPSTLTSIFMRQQKMTMGAVN